jgi:ubiquinone/menaquinone biosynthesis C-methylase UbiE
MAAVERYRPRVSPDTEAFQSYLVGVKSAWGNELFREVAREAAAVKADDPAGIERELKSSPGYQYFAWLEHYLQQYKYVGPYGIVKEFEGQSDEVRRVLDEAMQRGPGTITLDPGLELPRYYVEADFHQHPGGIWSDDIDAFAYEWAARTPFSVKLASETELHDRLARFIARENPSDILDLACGFGKTTFALKREMPNARVIGIDLSAPALKLAHLRAVEEGLEVDLYQQAAEKLSFPDASFDVVTATMFIHEVPPDALRAILRESRRVLRPGGKAIFLDFYKVPGGAVGMFFHLGHSDRNNEPYMRTLCGLDLARELRAAGFGNVEIEAFEEQEGALERGDDLPAYWRFPWTTIVGQAA